MSRTIIRLQGLWRTLLVHTVAGVVPYYVVNEYPKSGGTWLGQMVGEALGVPFPRHRMPLLRSSVMHGHYLHPTGMRNTLLLWRDGRDITVSWYYHCFFRSERTHPSFVEENRRALPFADYEDIRANLPRFIEYQFTRQKHPGFNWACFVEAWHDRPGVVYTSYEALRADPATELKRILAEIAQVECSEAEIAEVVARYSFERMAGRKAGQEDIRSFLRKGLVGDWKNVFTREAREVFHAHAGAALIALGYARDARWVDEDPPPEGAT
jgi:hypothetical protein